MHHFFGLSNVMVFLHFSTWTIHCLQTCHQYWLFTVLCPGHHSLFSSSVLFTTLPARQLGYGNITERDCLHVFIVFRPVDLLRILNNGLQRPSIFNLCCKIHRNPNVPQDHSSISTWFVYKFKCAIGVAGWKDSAIAPPCQQVVAPCSRLLVNFYLIGLVWLSKPCPRYNESESNTLAEEQGSGTREFLLRCHSGVHFKHVSTSTEFNCHSCV